MREGAHLRSHVHVARVREGSAIPLATGGGHYGAMPLPELTAAGDLTYRAVFELSGRVAATALRRGDRVACLSDSGIVLLLQRIAFSDTRFAVELAPLHATVAPVLDEASLMEDWLTKRTGPEIGTEQWPAALFREEDAFDGFMLEQVGGVTRRMRLADPQSRATVQRDVRQRLR